MTAVAKPEPREITLKDLPVLIRTSGSARQTIAPFLPEDVSLDRVAASLSIALAKDKAAWKGEGPSPLEQCSPMSVFFAVAKIAQWGLEIGETAHLVPFGTTCTPIADYKGLIELMTASGVVRMVDARCVYANEPFEMSVGTSTSIQHKVVSGKEARGAMIGAYAVFHVRGVYVPMVKYMGIDEIEHVRKTYSKQWTEKKVGPMPPWYAMKTVIRSGSKLLPKNPRLAKALAAFDDIDQAELELKVPEQLRALEGGAPAGEPVATTIPATAAPSPAWPLDDDDPAELDI